MQLRTIKQQHAAQRDDSGELMTRRPLPQPGIEYLDPFLFLNHHGPQMYAPGNGGLPFGPHPHRGFETVTFVIDGSLAHRDSGGHESVISAGGVQWMTAGRGIVHEELSPAAFLRDGGPLELLQLWINLPARLKTVAPVYVGLEEQQIPTVVEDSGRAVIKLVSGMHAGTVGALTSLGDVHMMTVQLAAGAELVLPAPTGHSIFLYVVRGEVSSQGHALHAQHLVELNDDGDGVLLTARAEALLLFGHALPLREPMVAGGPFVMNTEQEIQEAWRDYRSGNFGSLRLTATE